MSKSPITPTLHNGLYRDDNSSLIGVSRSNIDNRVTLNRDQDAIALGAMLRFNKTDTVLNIEDVTLSTQGAIALFEGLQDNTQLEELYVEFEDIDHAGAKALGRLLARNKSLRLFHITTGKAIAYRGAMAIANGLKNNWTLEVFYLKDKKSGEVDVLMNRKSDSNQWDSQRSLT